MSGPRNTKSDEWEIHNRREKIGRLYVQGKTQMQIVEQLKVWGTQVSQSTVSNDLAAIKELWMERSAGLFNVKMAEELAKLDELEREAWANYEASRLKENRTEQTREKEHEYQMQEGEGETPLQKFLNGKRVRVPSKSKYKEVVKENLPSTAWWDRMLQIVKFRCQLMGLTEAEGKQTNITVINWEQLVAGATQTVDDDPIQQRIDMERAGLVDKPNANGQPKRGK